MEHDNCSNPGTPGIKIKKKVTIAGQTSQSYNPKPNSLLGVRKKVLIYDLRANLWPKAGKLISFSS